MDALYAAKFNYWWYLSFVAPAIIMIGGSYWHKKNILIISVLFSLITTYALCNISVQTKWQTRLNIAYTQEEMNYACADGANLVFTAILIAPFESILYTWFWGFLGWKIWPRIRKKNTQQIVSP